MIDIKSQEEMFIAIGREISRKVSAYAIGGNAMMLKGIKNSTLDVDLVFDKYKDREEFMQALKKLGAKGSDVTIVYGLKENSPLMLEFNNCRFSLWPKISICASLWADKIVVKSLNTTILPLILNNKLLFSPLIPLIKV